VERQHRSDDELLDAAVRDPGAFGEFYERHAQAVLAYLVSLTRDPERSLDLTAEVFAAALESSSRYRGGEAPARAWLFGIARNKFAEGQRKRAAEYRARQRLGIPRLEFEDEDLERVERLLDQSPSDVLGLVTQRLPESERDAVIARVVHEADYRDVALNGNCSEQAARQRVSRGLGRLASWIRTERS